jgi:hypothetical protein
MTLDQIIKLLDAGYTKADIEAMQTQPAAAAAAEPEPQKETPAPAAEPEEKKPESEPVNAQMLKELQDLKKAVYAMNIMQSSQPAQPESVDDILAKALKEG